MVVDSLNDMFRTLQTKLSEVLKKRIQECGSKQAAAREIGISPGKLDKIINDDWDYITRDAIERVADRCGLEVCQVFEFVPSDFWRQIESGKRCTFLRGSRPAGTGSPTAGVPPHDLEATSIIERLFSSFAQEVQATFPEFLERDEDILAQARNQSCIVIGSPKSNRATEVLLSRFFGAKPFDQRPANRRKVPFGFSWLDDSWTAENSTLAYPRQPSAGKHREAGIFLKALRGDKCVPADYHSADDFRTLSTPAGRDCGLVFVANKPFQTREDIKLIVLAGFSGIGTIAAAQAVVQDFRDLEPMPKDEHACVYGLVDAVFRKRSGCADGREYRSFTWRYRKGGRAPIAFRERPEADRANQLP